jgi:hypothetical protein
MLKNHMESFEIHWSSVTSTQDVFGIHKF